MLTPQKIQDLADPIESIYINMVEELLRNIGRHVTKPNWTHTAVWEVQKLSELGQLTQENAAIINKWIKSMPAELRETMEATRAAALDKLEKELERAAQAGHISPAITDSTVEVLQNYLEQAADRLNLVNTTMLQSSLDQYARAVQLTADIERRAERTQELLNEAAANVATGVETRQQALNRAIKQIAAEGLTGFIDKAGRHWTPEAYVNMDIRTTVHNVAIQSTRARMEDYNTQVFQISSHAGARPLCYPYQGKFYSWNNTSGLIALGNGKMVDFAPLNSTSYGQPAGIFGINCGHYPIPVIPGVSIPHGADFIQPKEENDKLYAESQEQRALERKIRAAKRVVDMAGSTATKADRQAVRAAQQQMREFIERTGRTRRYDREKIVKNNSIKPEKTLNTYADPMREKMGSAFVSHPREIEKILKTLEQKGVEVSYRAGSMSYSPSSKTGKPGIIIMDPEASYSAWLHELKHMEDDESSGWQGIKLIMNTESFAELEARAYKVEIDFARENGYNKIARRLERLSFERGQEIRGTQRNNKQTPE